jgi:hypothetical protein
MKITKTNFSHHIVCHLAKASAPCRAFVLSDSSLQCSVFHRHNEIHPFLQHPFELQVKRRLRVIHHLTSIPTQPSLSIFNITNLPSVTAATSQMKIQIYVQTELWPQKEIETCLGSLN